MTSTTDTTDKDLNLNTTIDDVYFNDQIDNVINDTESHGLPYFVYYYILTSSKANESHNTLSNGTVNLASNGKAWKGESTFLIAQIHTHKSFEICTEYSHHCVR